MKLISYIADEYDTQYVGVINEVAQLIY